MNSISNLFFNFGVLNHSFLRLYVQVWIFIISCAVKVIVVFHSRVRSESFFWRCRYNEVMLSRKALSALSMVPCISLGALLGSNYRVRRWGSGNDYISNDCHCQTAVQETLVAPSCLYNSRLFGIWGSSCARQPFHSGIAKSYLPA